MASDDQRDGESRRRHDDSHDSRSRSDHRSRRRSPKDEEDRSRRKSRERRRSRTPDSSSRHRHGRERERERDRDRDRDHKRHRDRSRDRGGREEQHRRTDRDGRRRRDRSEEADARASPVKRGGPLPSQEDSFAVTRTGEGGEPEKPKEKPNFGNTGLLAAASNSVAQADGTSIALKYHEPAEARKPPPRDQWKLYVFKGADIVDTIDLSLRSCWLVGREMAVVDLPAEHPSISKQHAVIQFRYTEKRNEFGDKVGRVKPYLIDLESANGTVLNDSKIPDSRYLELRDKDMIQFGQSTREYVVMLAPRE